MPTIFLLLFDVHQMNTYSYIFLMPLKTPVNIPGSAIGPRIQWKKQRVWLYINVLGSCGYENNQCRLLKS